MSEKNPEQLEKLVSKWGRYKQQKIDKILAENEQQQIQFAVTENMNFTRATREQLEKKLSGSNSPIIVWQSWTSSVAPGGTVNYSLGINNPDPFQQISMFVHLLIRPANMLPDIGGALPLVEPRLPKITMPKFTELSIAAGATASLSFSIVVPTSIQPGNCLGNSFLLRTNWHDVDEYLDRSVFVFKVLDFRQKKTNSRVFLAK